MQRIKHAIIACAGTGSRLGFNIPKCLIEINGTKIIKNQLDLLRDIEHIRVVVGFKENEVTNCIKEIRPDAVFIRNKDFLSKGNSYTFKLGTLNIKEPYLWLDGDVLLKKDTYNEFISYSAKKNKIVLGINKAQTSEALFTILNNKKEVVNFSYTTDNKKDSFEWSGIAYFPANSKFNFSNQNQYYIYELLQNKLPLKAYLLEGVYEIDTYEDYLLAKKYFK